ncbi:hypothetical protein C3941_19580 [Kaistia algarum]|uniref:hypothetical protein n=1 Tax=Kaistia algarum TaxID=2083279 RepID=UPI000CE759B5|nr:hypothetical protein [Kaistia algarum]MCX5516194.1 hypothetical protein [Kaistia algarum]PPE78268.1 hypothetical protein C3941_19580 [Kaistia algarum]
MSGDTILSVVIIGGLCALVIIIALRVHYGFKANPSEDEPMSELVTDEDEADPVYPFRRIGPIAADVVAKLDGGR